MTTEESVARVVDRLVTVGFRVVEELTVASVPFEFATVLVGSNRAHDLIVVIDTLTEPELRMRQKVQGLSRALDLVGSRRPLTVILVGPSQTPGTMEALGKVSRVLAVDALATDEGLVDALAVLLPLDIQDAADSVVDALGELRTRVPPDEDDTLSMFYDAAFDGADAVTAALQSIVAQPLAQLSEGADS